MNPRKNILFIVIFLCSAFIHADEESSVFDYMDKLADEALSVVRNNIPGGGERDTAVISSGIEVNGEAVILGDLFSRKFAVRAAGSKIPGVTVLSRDYDRMLEEERGKNPSESRELPADYVITGSAFKSESRDELLIVIQLLRVDDAVVMGGFEKKIPLTEDMEDYLHRKNSRSAEGDDFENDDSYDEATVLGPDDYSEGHNLLPCGDCDWFVLSAENLPEGRDVLLTVFTTGTTDTYMELYGPDDPFNLLDESDDWNDENSMVRVSARKGQKFWVMVRGYGDDVTGFYGIKTEMEEIASDSYEPDNSMEAAGELSPDGEAVLRSLIPDDDEDWMFVQIPESADDRVLLNVETSGNTDTFLELYNSDGDFLIDNDDSGSENNAKIQYLVSPGKLYYLMAVSSEYNSTGEYGISASIQKVIHDSFEPDNSPDEASLIEPGSVRQKHSFVPADDSDWYFFTISEQHKIEIRTYGDSDTSMYLFDGSRRIISEDSLIAEDDDGGEDYNALIVEDLSPGTYYILVTQLYDDPVIGNEYSISLNPAE